MRKALIFVLCTTFFVAIAMEKDDVPAITCAEFVKTRADLLDLETTYREGVWALEKDDERSLCIAVAGLAGNGFIADLSKSEDKQLQEYVLGWARPIYDQLEEEGEAVIEDEYRQKEKQKEVYFFIGELGKIKNFSALAKWVIGRKQPLLSIAIEKGKSSEILSGMIQAGADPNGSECDFDFYRPLHGAVERCAVYTVKLLLDKGAYPDQEDLYLAHTLLDRANRHLKKLRSVPKIGHVQHASTASLKVELETLGPKRTIEKHETEIPHYQAIVKMLCGPLGIN